MRFAFLILVLAAFSFSSAAKEKMRALAEYSSSPEFSKGELFKHLDSFGQNGNWMEFDKSAALDSSVKKILESFRGENVQILAAWGLFPPNKKNAFSVLFKTPKGETLRFFDLSSFEVNSIPLEVQNDLDPNVIFSEYVKTGENEFSHRENVSLKVQIFPARILWRYEKIDAIPLRFDDSFSKLRSDEQEKIVLEYADFFRYEYALMLRAFVQTTRGIFNWQPWHWYFEEFSSKYFISEKEIRSMLSAKTRPQMIRIFSAKTSSKKWIEMRIDGNGRYEMEVRSE